MEEIHRIEQKEQKLFIIERPKYCDLKTKIS